MDGLVFLAGEDGIVTSEAIAPFVDDDVAAVMAVKLRHAARMDACIISRWDEESGLTDQGYIVPGAGGTNRRRDG